MTSFVYIADPCGLPTVEMVFPLASPAGHKTVRTGVACALMRLRPLASIPAAETTDGLTVYYLRYNNVYVQFIIAEVTELLANLQITIVGKLVGPHIVQLPDESLLVPEIIKEITVVLNAVDRSVVDFLRKAYTLDELKPPAPPLEDIAALVYYHRIYFPLLTDEEFAKQVHISVQTYRNRRAASGLTQHNFRPSPIDWSEVRPDMPEELIPRWAREKPKRRRKR
jgi:hypothetical protein